MNGCQAGSPISNLYAKKHLMFIKQKELGNSNKISHGSRILFSYYERHVVLFFLIKIVLSISKHLETELNPDLYHTHYNIHIIQSK